MDCADELRAEDVRKIGRDGGETAAIHGQDDTEGENEKRLVAHRRERRRQRVKNDAENEEAEISVLAADLV